MNPTNSLLLKSALNIASKTKSSAVLLYIDALDDLSYPDPIPRSVRLIMFTKRKKVIFDDNDTHSLHKRAVAMITLPKINLSRTSMLKIAVLIALTQEQIQEGEQIVCIVGQTALNQVDCIQIIDTAKETELITTRGVTRISEALNPEIFQSVLNLSIELADKGREGKPIGTTFVVGDEEKVLQYSKQMIINPFKGYEEEERNILSPGIRETIREFASLDGAFIINNDGVVLTAGCYLNAASDDSMLPQGLGSRHIAAAGITSLTNAVAFVISESSGDLRIFKNGKILMEIEKSAKQK